MKTNQPAKMNKSKIVDSYNLEKDDEFYQILENFSQVSDEGSVRVKPCTYALMTWWKVRMGNRDSIDITNESNNSSLQFHTSVNGSDEHELSLTADESVTISNIVEVDEKDKIVQYFGYIEKAIPSKLVKEVEKVIKDYNYTLAYGYSEITNVGEGDKTANYLRFKASTILEGIKVGKIDAVSNLVSNAQSNFYLTVFELANSPSLKSWLIK
jgi:hypothetical protein